MEWKKQEKRNTDICWIKKLMEEYKIETCNCHLDCNLQWPQYFKFLDFLYVWAGILLERCAYVLVYSSSSPPSVLEEGASFIILTAMLNLVYTSLPSTQSKFLLRSHLQFFIILNFAHSLEKKKNPW